jgi:hypothetical protein
MKLLHKISIVIFFFICTSCYESLDFNQLDHYLEKPVLTSSFIYFNALPKQFFDASGMVQKNTISEAIDFQIFENGFIKENVVEMDFNIEIENQFDREVKVYIEFINKNGLVIYTFAPIEVASNNLDYKFLEQIVISENPGILNVSKIKLTLELEETGVQMNPNNTNEFKFKSSLTYFVETNF